MKKQLALLLSAAIAGSLALTGCGNSQPKTAAELLNKYLEGTHNNYNMSPDVGMNINMNISGMDMEIPVSIDGDFAVAGNYGHGNLNMTIDYGDLSEYLSALTSAFSSDDSVTASAEDETVTEDSADTSQTTAYEIYFDTSDADNVVLYSSQNGSDSWTKVTSEDSAYAGVFTDMQSTLLSDGLFDDATMEYDKSSKEYTVTMSTNELLDNSDFTEMLTNMLSSSSEVSSTVDTDELLAAFEDKNIVYVFDNDLNLVSIDMDKITYETTEESYGISMTMSMEINMSYKFSSFGSVKEDDVKVPADVADEAVAASSSLSDYYSDTEDIVSDEEIDDENETESVAASNK